MNRREYVENANLNYHGTSARCEDGLPIGNGRMGSMVWTSPASIKLQINRTDVYANSSASNSFVESHTDYGYACGFLDIDFAGYGEDVFDDKTLQCLNVYDAAIKLDAGDLHVSAFADANRDVFAFTVDDQRSLPQMTEIRLRMMRPSIVRTRSHVAYSKLIRVGQTAVLLQEFMEDDYYCSSAVAVRAVSADVRMRIDDENNGERPVLPEQKESPIGSPCETVLRMILPQEKGSWQLYVSSCATFDKNDDVVSRAVSLVDEAVVSGYQKNYDDHQEWWHSFWDRSYVRLTGDERAQKITEHYIYFFYILASCSRGSAFAPNFGGLLFSPRGDYRLWGVQQWWNNLSLTYNAAMPAGYDELMMPYFDMYFNMYHAAERSARQIWDAEGIYIGETTNAMGPASIPEEIAGEMRDLMLGRKPWAQRSEAYRRYTSHKNRLESAWQSEAAGGNRRWENGEFRFEENPYGPYGHVSHLFSSQATLAWHYWLYYEFTGDECFLRDKAYPMIRGVVEFFRTHPHCVKESDGKYHFLHSSYSESFWGGKDSLGTMYSMYGLIPVALKAAKLLTVDADLCGRWQELLDNLSPLPTTDDPDYYGETRPEHTEWAGCRGAPVAHINPDIAPYPCIFFDLCNTETQNVAPEMYRIGMNMIRKALAWQGQERVRLSMEMSNYPLILAAMGVGDSLLDVIVGQIDGKYASYEHCGYEENGSKAVYRNRLTAREGINAISAQRLGNVAAGLQMGLLQATGGAPGMVPIIHVFPAWDKNCDAEFELWTRGGFRISSAMKQGQITYVDVLASRDSELRMKNPWQKADVHVKDDAEAHTLSGELLTIPMQQGKKLRFMRK